MKEYTTIIILNTPLKPTIDQAPKVCTVYTKP